MREKWSKNDVEVIAIRGQGFGRELGLLAPIRLPEAANRARYRMSHARMGRAWESCRIGHSIGLDLQAINRAHARTGYVQATPG